MFKLGCSPHTRVIDYERLIPDAADVDAYISFSNADVGRFQGEFVRDTCQLNKSGDALSIEFFAGPENDTNAQVFFDNAYAVVEPFFSSGRLITPSGDTDFEDVQTEGWMTDNAYDRMAWLIEDTYSGGRPDIVLCSNDSTAAGVIRALLDAGFDAGDMPVITGQDCDVENLRYIRNGLQSMSILKDSVTIAKRLTGICLDLVNGRTPEYDGTVNNGAIDVPFAGGELTVVTADNYQDYQTDTLLVGVSLPTNEADYWLETGRRIRERMSWEGIDVDVRYAQATPSVQTKQLQSLIDEGVDVLVVAAVDASQVTAKLAAARSKGIPVIAYERLIYDTADLDGYISYDNSRVGELQGEFVRDICELDDDSEPLTIEFFAGPDNDTNARIFFESACEVLEPYFDSGRLVTPSGETTFEAVQTRGWMTKNAYDRMVSLLQTYYKDGVPDIVLCSNDTTALGVTQALQELRGGKDMPVITGQDCDIENVRNIRRGIQSMSVFKDNNVMIERLTELCAALVHGEEPEFDGSIDNGKIEVPFARAEPTVVTQENLWEVLVESGFYSEDDLN